METGAIFVEDGQANWGKEVGRIYQQHSRLLWRVFFARCNDPTLASDALQECFHRLLRQRPDEIRHPLSWLRFVGKNYIIDQARRQSAKHDSESIPDIPDSTSIESWVTCSRKEQHVRLMKALARLSQADRHVLLMRYMQHQSSKQIGHATGKSSNAVDMSLSRARQRLAVAMHTV